MIASVGYLKEKSEGYLRTMGLNGSGDLYVDDLLAAMPSNLRLLVLQLNENGSGIYAGVGSKEKMPGELSEVSG